MDLRREPFSRRGTWWSIARLTAYPGRPAGLFLRTHHANEVSRDLMHLETLNGDEPVELACQATPTRLRLGTAARGLDICMPRPGRIRLRGTGLGLRLTTWRQHWEMLIPQSGAAWILRLGSHNLSATLTAVTGQATAVMQPDEAGKRQFRFTLRPAADGSCELVIDDTRMVEDPVCALPAWADDLATVEAEWRHWLDRALPAPASLAATRAKAAYVGWSAIVAPSGAILREAMLMSKNYMDHVWSWDHCFNAMATATQDVDLAWDQFAMFFDHQAPDGSWPDSIRDNTVCWLAWKPPIHGWALAWMLRRGVRFDRTRLAQAYAALSRQAELWLARRDGDDDGIPGYHCGADSGWDNGTSFDTSPTGEVESPDLSAYLILQLDTLADLARRLGHPAAARRWRQRADDLLAALIAHSWRDDRFVALQSGAHQPSGPGDCLLDYVPLVLGERLPRPIFRRLATGLATPGRFLTRWGLATESPRSPLYKSDGYWRGPIWAPSTMLIVDGLHRGGAKLLAANIAQRFCRLCRRSGFAENFDAVSGAPLRDQAYTWTSSVFQLLANGYLGTRR